MLTDLTYQLQNPVWKTENDQRLVDLTHQLKDAIWKAKGVTDHPDDRSQNTKPEDIGLQPGNTPDTPGPNHRAEDTTGTKDPGEDISETRPTKHHVPAYRITYLNNLPSDNFLIPLQHGFHREVVRSANGKNLTVYYYTENGVQLRTKKDVDTHIMHLQGITRDDFNFSGIVLPIDDPNSQCQSVRPANVSHRMYDRHRLTHHITHQEYYQTTDDVETK